MSNLIEPDTKGALGGSYMSEGPSSLMPPHHSLPRSTRHRTVGFRTTLNPRVATKA